MKRVRFARLVASLAALESFGESRQFVRVANLELIEHRVRGQDVLFNLFATTTRDKIDGEERFVVGHIEDLNALVFVFRTDVRHDLDRDLILSDFAPRFGNKEFILAAEAHRADVSARSNALAIFIVGLAKRNAFVDENAAGYGTLLREPAHGAGRLKDGEVKFLVARP